MCNSDSTLGVRFALTQIQYYSPKGALSFCLLTFFLRSLCSPLCRFVPMHNCQLTLGARLAFTHVQQYSTKGTLLFRRLLNFAFTQIQHNSARGACSFCRITQFDCCSAVCFAASSLCVIVIPHCAPVWP